MSQSQDVAAGLAGASAYLNADDVYVVELADDRASLGDVKTLQGQEEAQLPLIPVEV